MFPVRGVVVFPMQTITRSASFICYESVFPDDVRQFAKGGADLLVNISNDGYFGHSAAREQHLDIVRMRAAENRRWILRATNDGVTAVIDPAGRVPIACRLHSRRRPVRIFLRRGHHVLYAARRLVCLGVPVAERGVAVLYAVAAL